METIFMNTENSKANEPHQVILKLSQRLDLSSSNKHVALQNLSIYNVERQVSVDWRVLFLSFFCNISVISCSYFCYY